MYEKRQKRFKLTQVYHKLWAWCRKIRPRLWFRNLVCYYSALVQSNFDFGVFLPGGYGMTWIILESGWHDNGRSQHNMESAWINVSRNNMAKVRRVMNYYDNCDMVCQCTASLWNMIPDGIRWHGPPALGQHYCIGGINWRDLTLQLVWHWLWYGLPWAWHEAASIEAHKN